MQMYYKEYIMRFKVHWKSNHCILDLVGSNQFAGLKLNIHKMKISSKITASGDCSHEIKRHLLFGRKTMTNIDKILKSRDIILPTKVCIVKAMVFPVVMMVGKMKAGGEGDDRG